LPFIAIGVKETYPDLRILLVIDQKESMEDDSLFNGIEVSEEDLLNHFLDIFSRII